MTQTLGEIGRYVDGAKITGLHVRKLPEGFVGVRIALNQSYSDPTLGAHHLSDLTTTGGLPSADYQDGDEYRYDRGNAAQEIEWPSLSASRHITS